MADKKVDVRFGEEVVGRTIVGGRNHATASGTVAIPVGIEQAYVYSWRPPALALAPDSAFYKAGGVAKVRAWPTPA
jgi:hypothetical protein